MTTDARRTCGAKRLSEMPGTVADRSRKTKQKILKLNSISLIYCPAGPGGTSHLINRNAVADLILFAG